MPNYTHTSQTKNKNKNQTNNDEKNIYDLEYFNTARYFNQWILNTKVIEILENTENITDDIHLFLGDYIIKNLDTYIDLCTEDININNKKILILN